MLFSATDLQEPTTKRTAEIAKALGHPARIAILSLLSDHACFCGDITQILPLAQSTVSQHLKALKKAGLIKGEIEGVRTCYCLDENGIREMNELLPGFIEKLLPKNTQNCC